MKHHSDCGGIKCYLDMKKLQCPDFILGNKLTEEQLAFFSKNGVIVFRDVLKKETIEYFIQEIQRIEKQLLDEGLDKINGVPLKFGKDENNKTIIQRLCFLSLHSRALHEFLQDPRLQALIEFLQPYDGRIAENEKDGLILNHYVRTPESKFSQIYSSGKRLCPCLM
jgi:phytanoyl-CoA hydroxylase